MDIINIPIVRSDDVALLHRERLRRFGAENFSRLRQSQQRNAYLHGSLRRIITHNILPGARVLDVGCGDGGMLSGLGASYGVGIDINPAAITEARARHPELVFREMSAEETPSLNETFDYVLLSGVLPQLYDLHTAMEALRAVCHDRTRIVVVTFSRLWQPLIRLSELMRWKVRVPEESWIPSFEVKNLLSQCGYEHVTQKSAILCPMKIPLLSDMMNRWIAPLPGVRHLGLCLVTVARMLPRNTPPGTHHSVTIVVPARNEAGNIKPLLDRIPSMGKSTEVIFVEGNSSDDTWPAIGAALAEYRASGGPLHVRCLQQTGKGKGDAVRLGFREAKGDILAILDADISVPPEELGRFVELVASHYCEFANGSRLVYPMEDNAMRFLNMLANKLFGWMFTYLLDQRIRDTLCGTKVLRKADYERIAANRAYFGDFDPFGDFDLLFGAARLGLRIADVPVHYRQRIYGSTNINRFRHGLLLLRMCCFAARRIKFV